MTKPIQWAVGAAVLIGAVLGVPWARRAVGVHQTMARSLPAIPDLAQWPAEFSQQVGTGDRAARGYVNPVPALAKLATLYHANGFFAEAMQCYSALQTVDAAEARWPYLHAHLLADFGRLDEAIALYRTAVSLAPHNATVQLRLADALLKANQPAEAQLFYSTVLKTNPADPYALLGLARASVLAQHWTEAQRGLESAVAAHPDFFGGWALLATVDEHLGRTPEAVVARRKAKSAGRFRDLPDPWVETLNDECYSAYQLSIAAASTVDVARGRRWLERAIALEPGVGSYQRQLARALFNAKDRAGARQQVDAALILAPHDSDAWALLLQLLEGSASDGEVARTLDAALAQCPQSAYLHFAKGKYLRTRGRLAEAAAELQYSKKLEPNEARAYLETALLCFQQERVEDGMAEIDRALVVEPGNALAAQLRARYAIHSADEPMARRLIQTLRESPEARPADVSALGEEFRQQFGRVP